MHSFKNCALFFVEWVSIVCLLFIYKYPLYFHSTRSIKQVKKKKNISMLLVKKITELAFLLYIFFNSRKGTSLIFFETKKSVSVSSDLFHQLQKSLVNFFEIFITLQRRWIIRRTIMKRQNRLTNRIDTIANNCEEHKWINRIYMKLIQSYI